MGIISGDVKMNEEIKNKLAMLSDHFNAYVFYEQNYTCSKPDNQSITEYYRISVSGHKAIYKSTLNQILCLTFDDFVKDEEE